RMCGKQRSYGREFRVLPSFEGPSGGTWAGDFRGGRIIHPMRHASANRERTANWPKSARHAGIFGGGGVGGKVHLRGSTLRRKSNKCRRTATFGIVAEWRQINSR